MYFLNRPMLVLQDWITRFITNYDCDCFLIRLICSSVEPLPHLVVMCSSGIWCNKMQYFPLLLTFKMLMLPLALSLRVKSFWVISYMEISEAHLFHCILCTASCFCLKHIVEALRHWTLVMGYFDLIKILSGCFIFWYCLFYWFEFEVTLNEM